MGTTDVTPFETQAAILAELWIEYRYDENFSDFIEYNDLGLPLAYAVSNSIAEVDGLGRGLIEETFDVLLQGLELEDTGFDNLSDLLDVSDVTALVDEDVDEVEEEEEDDGEYLDPYIESFELGVKTERERTQDIVKMHMRWAEEQNKGRDYMFWKSVGEVLTPIEIKELPEDEDFF